MKFCSPPTGRTGFYYSLSGEFLGETPVDDILFEFSKKGDKIYSHLMLYDGPEFAIYELDGRAVKSVRYPKISKLKRNPNGGKISLPLGRMLNASKEGMLFTRTFDNTIYRVENDELVPYRTMDFGRFYREEAGRLSTEEVSELTRQGVIYSITNARLMGENRLIFNGYPNGVFVVEGDRARQHGWQSSELTLHGNMDIVPILDPETEYVAFSHPATHFVDHYRMVATDSSRYTAEMARLARLTENDNPVILLYRLK